MMQAGLARETKNPRISWRKDISSKRILLYRSIKLQAAFRRHEQKKNVCVR